MGERRRDEDDDDRGSRRDRDDDRGGRGSGRFRYQPRSAEATRQRAERNVYGNDPFLSEEVKLFKPKVGDNTVRILPATWEDSQHYGIDVFVHQGIGADRTTYLCLEKMKNKPCPICEARKRASAEGDQEFADQLRVSSRVFMYVVDRDKEREGAMVWNMGARQDADILKLCTDKRSGEVLQIDNPDEGYDLQFTREGEGLKTRYSAFSFVRRPSALDLPKALDFAVQHPLPDQLVFYSYDHIAKSFAGTKPKDDSDDQPRRRSTKDEDETPTRRTPKDDDDKPASRRRGTPDLTWDDVHQMSFTKLSALIEDERLKVDPEASRNDDELADEVCEALGIEKTRGRSRRDADEAPSRRKLDDDDDPPARRKLRDAARERD